MIPTVTQYIMSPETWDRAIRDAAMKVEFTDAAGIESIFGIKSDLLNDMVKRGEIKKHKLTQHRQPTLYNVAEIRKLIKPLI